VITNSGGLQKEAYFGGKRRIILMPDTAWREIVESIHVYLKGANFS